MPGLEDNYSVRVGITSDLHRCRMKTEKLYSNVANWSKLGVFKNRSEARSWMREVAHGFQCSCDEESDDGVQAGTRWYGYYFEHDKVSSN